MVLRNVTLDKLLLWIGCGLLLIFFVPVTLVTLWQLPEAKEESLVETSRLVAKRLARSIQDPILTRDSYGTGRLLKEAARRGDSIIYGVLIDSRGKVAAHTFRKGVPADLSALLSSHSSGAIRFQSSKGPLLDMAYPIMEGQLGSLHLGISRKNVTRTQQRMVLTALGILAAALLVLLAGIRRISLLVSRPLSDLERTTRDFSLHGTEPDSPLSLSGTVEVRNIAARFLFLLNQLNVLERMLPPSRRKAFRGKEPSPPSRVFSPALDVPPREREEVWSEAYLENRYSWLVFHRWVAFCGIILSWLVYLAMGRRQVSSGDVLVFLAAMGLWNAFFQFRSRWPVFLARGPVRSWLLVQIVSDLLFLTILLHLFGGMENPFKIFYVFIIVIAGLTFPFRLSGLLALLGSFLYSGVVIGEMASYLPHHSLLGFPGLEISGSWREPTMVFGEVAAMAIVQMGVVVFVHTVSARRREAETAKKTAEAIALSRERLAILGELAAGVAHEVRNPIHGLLNCLDLLRKRVGSDGDTMELLSLLEEGLRRISTISDRLLHLGREGGEPRGPVDLPSIVESTVKLVRETARKKDVDIVVRSGGKIPLFEGEADRLSEALLNLLTNSLNATPKKGRITVLLEGEGDPVDTAKLVVSDTGSGIPPGVLDKVFDPFFTTKGAGEGSGLGLSLVQETIRRHGGAVEIESAPGEGTVVTINLPVPGRERARESRRR